MTSAERIAVAFICAGLVASTGPTPAQSADLWKAPEPDLHRPELPWATWQGFHVGADVGHAWGLVDSHVGPTSVNANGFIGGLHGGYNRQIGNLVLGVEGDYGWTGADGRAHLGTNTLDAHFGGHGSVRFRLGAAADKILFFGTVGYGWSTVALNFDDGFGRTTRSQTDSGLVYGGGIEMKIAPRVSIRTELLRYDVAGLWQADDGTRIKLYTPLTELRAGLTWHFNTLR